MGALPSRRLWPWLALLLLLGALWALGEFLPLRAWAEEVAAWLRALGPWGPVIFALAYAAATVLLVPGSPLSVIAGASLGLLPAVASVFAGAVLGSTAALLLARSALRARVERRLAAHPRLAALDRLMGERGAGAAFLLRLTPALPFSLLNYALGLTRLSVRDSLLASPAMLPGILLYAGTGAALGAAATQEAGSSERAVVLAAGALAAVVVAVWLARVARRALPPAADQGRDASQASS